MAADDDASEGKKRISKEAVDRVKKETIYGVGYGRPPKEKQFKPKQSGNPKGRPRGVAHDLTLSDEPVLQAVRKLLSKTVQVREGDTYTEVTALEAAMQATLAQAYKGNARSAGLIFDLKRTADQAHAREVKERIELWTKYKTVFGDKLAEAARQGKPAPMIVPHPDDIVIDNEVGVRFIGPFDEREQKQMNDRLALRDLLLMQEALDERCRPHSSDTAHNRFGMAFLIADRMNKSVPSRHRLSDIAMMLKIDRYLGTAKRILLKDLYGGWRKIGRPQRRGFLSPQEGPLADGVRFIVDFANHVRAGRVEFEDVNSGNPSEEFLELLEKHGLPIEPYLHPGA